MVPLQYDRASKKIPYVLLNDESGVVAKSGLPVAVVRGAVVASTSA